MFSVSSAGSSDQNMFPRVAGHKWIATFDGGSSRVIHASVLIRDFIYVFGGCRLADLSEEHEPIEILALHIETFQWKILEPPNQSPDEVPFMRYGHTVVERDGYAYLFGGRSSFKFCNDLFRYDPVAHLWEKIQTNGCVPNSLLGHSMSIVDDVAYVYGGLDNSLNISTGDTYALNFRNFQWLRVEQIGNLPSNRYFHSACVMGRKIYVFGGHASGNRLRDRNILHCNQIRYFDVDTLTWHRPDQQGNIPSGRRSHAAFVYGGQMFIHGGQSDSNDKCYGDAYRFNPQNAKWDFFPIHVGDVRIPPSRRSHTIILAGDRLFLIGGVTILHAEKFSMSLEGCLEEDDEELFIETKNFFVLDMRPSLRTLCMARVIRNELDRSQLPQTVQTRMSRMFTSDNTIRTGCREE